ncbi:MAG: hypothetical protein PHY26_00480 [Bacilli bacterium]|jgi:hypothetical protein|nr:hypothetical protein [Bacilli bacterium]
MENDLEQIETGITNDKNLQIEYEEKIKTLEKQMQQNIEIIRDEINPEIEQYYALLNANLTNNEKLTFRLPEKPINMFQRNIKEDYKPEKQYSKVLVR